MVKKTLKAMTLTALTFGVTNALADRPHGDLTRYYEITITNLTQGQVLTPALVVNHGFHYRLFTLGEPASEGLAILAETGSPAAAATEAADSGDAFDVQTDTDVIPPGHSRSITIASSRYARKLTVAGMLATTNDAFYAIDNVRLPWWGSQSHYAYAYDAGSEANNEKCDYIPGPPCGGDKNENHPDMDDFVRIHNGIHGIGDLSSAGLDWRGPVAKITVKMVE